MAAEKQGPRVSYSTGRKLGDNKYGSFDFHISFSDDVGDDETPEEAYERVKTFVEKKSRSRLKEHMAEKDQEREERKRRLVEDDENLDRQIKRKSEKRTRDDD